MKRGADALDGAGWSDFDRNPNWRRLHQGTSNKRMRCSDESAPVVTVRTLADEKETDLHRLAQRQKQIDYGKNTIGYDRYCAQVPRHQRRPGKHPMTPDKTKKMGKKVFDGVVRKWRQALHKYDPPELTESIKTEPAASTAEAFAPSSGEVEVKSENAGPSAKPVEVKSESPKAATPPSHSIYDSFDEDNFDEEDSDDDLL